MTTPDIPDEAVEAAARALCIKVLEYGDCQGHGNFTRGKQYCGRGYSTAEVALTAAAPIIAAQAAADLRAGIEALRDEWRAERGRAAKYHYHAIHSESAVDALDALLGGA